MDEIVETPEEEPTEEQILEVDGEQFTAKQIRELQKTEHNLLTDYHHKTEEVAEQRRAVTTEREALKKEQDELNAKAAAYDEGLRKDLDYYTSRPATEYDPNRVSEVDRALGHSPKGTQVVTTELDSRMAEMEARVAKQDDAVKQMRVEAAGNKADASNKFAEQVVSKTYPLADINAVKDRMYVHFSREGRIPTNDEIKAMAKQSHERVAGLEVIRRGGSGGSLPPAGSGGLPEMPKDIPKLGDLSANIAAGKAFFARRRAQRGENK